MNRWWTDADKMQISLQGQGQGQEAMMSELVAEGLVVDCMFRWVFFSAWLGSGRAMLGNSVHSTFVMVGRLVS